KVLDSATTVQKASSPGKGSSLGESPSQSVVEFVDVAENSSADSHDTFSHLFRVEKARIPSGLNALDYSFGDDALSEANAPSITSVAELHHSKLPDESLEEVPRARNYKTQMKQPAWLIVNSAMTAIIKLMARDNNVNAQYDPDIIGR